jgi:exodeoxyribonuclease V gamma subunit
MLQACHSNDLDALADALAERLRREPLPPLVPEIVVVPATSTGRWLALALADRLGASANIRCVLPAAYAWELIRRVLPEVPERSPFAPERIFWRLVRALSNLPPTAANAPLHHYLRSGDIAARIALAVELAALLERYTLYRPEWIEAWLAGKRKKLGAHEAWQAELVTRLAAESPSLPHAHPKERFFAAIGADLFASSAVPRRVSLFAIGALPPLYLEFFARLGDVTEVTCYVPNPCREYWGHVARARTIERARQAHSPATNYLESGNRLFASLAQHGRAFFDALVALDVPSAERYVEPTGASLLAGLQRDLLTLVEPTERMVLDRHDESLRLAICHGPMREAEVLHDYLLELFERDATLRPEDILVLAPDMERDGAALAAVFGAVPTARFIPFAVADGHASAGAPIVQSFFALLEVVQGRLAADAVLGLLYTSAVLKRFRIDADEVPQLHDWVERLGVRWAADEHMRGTLGLPAERATTWQAGLDRLVVGAALGDDTRFADVEPFVDVEGAGAALAGRFAAFAERLFALAQELRRPRTPSAWRDLFGQALDDCFAPTLSEEQALLRVRESLAGMAADAEESGFKEAVPARAMIELLRAALERTTHAGRFKVGGVTIAELSASRIVPARVICVVGLNDGAFPRREPRRGFDLIEADPRPGDRRRRDEDRYAFLWALVAAREKLYLSYCGRGLRDDGERSPSVVLAELLDAVRRRAIAADGSDAVAQLLRAHPLQPFSARYGASSSTLGTYATEWHPAETIVPAPFACRTLPPPEAAWNDVTLEDFVRFWSKPAQFLLRERLGVRLARAEETLPAHEPFLSDGLAAFRVRELLVRAVLAGPAEPRDLASRLIADALLPSGKIGDARLAAFGREIAPLVDAIRATGPAEASAPIDVALEGCTLTGRLSGLGAGGRCEWRPGPLRARFRVAAWVRHLALNVACAHPTASVLLGLDEGKLQRFALRGLPSEQARERLAELLRWYREGLTAPLPFFPETSWAYFKGVRDAQVKPDVDPLARARLAWSGNEYARGDVLESADAYFALAMRDRSTPFDERFKALAIGVFAPLAECAEPT